MNRPAGFDLVPSETHSGRLVFSVFYHRRACA